MCTYRFALLTVAIKPSIYSPSRSNVLQALLNTINIEYYYILVGIEQLRTITALIYLFVCYQDILRLFTMNTGAWGNMVEHVTAILWGGSPPSQYR
jgi:hypothetical protein